MAAQANNKLLAYFVHRNCDTKRLHGCSTYAAIDIIGRPTGPVPHARNSSGQLIGTPTKVESPGGQQKPGPTVADSIRTAVKGHFEATHRGANNKAQLEVVAAVVAWKGEGKGFNLMEMSDEDAKKQIELAFARHCIDCLRIEFAIKLV